MRIWYLSADRGIPVAGTKGASAHVRSLVRAFTELGHQVTLIGPEPESGSPEAVPPLLPGARFEPIGTPRCTTAAFGRLPIRMARALGHLWNNIAVEETLDRLAAGGLPDLLCERMSPFGVAGGAFAARHGLRLVLEVNSPLAWEGAAYRGQALAEAAQALEAEALRAAGTVMTVSRELREILIESGVPAARITVVPNGVDTGVFTPHGATERKVPPDRIVIGFVGSLKPWHGLDLLAGAFEQLAGDPRYHLLVVGTGPEERLVEDLARRHPGRITRVGAVAQAHVPALLRGVDIAVAPYPALERFYFSPLKILEYMASGRAIVAGSIGQVPTLLEEGKAGCLVPPGDALALAGALRTLGEDAGRRAALGAAAREAAVRSHRWVDRAGEILRLAGEGAAC